MLLELSSLIWGRERGEGKGGREGRAEEGGREGKGRGRRRETEGKDWRKKGGKGRGEKWGVWSRTNTG